MRYLFLISLMFGMLIFGCTQTEPEKLPVIENKTVEQGNIEKITPKDNAVEPNKSTETEKQPENKTYVVKTPIDSLSDEAIKEWDVNCKDKTTKEAIAQCILDWQENNFYWCYLYPEKTPYPAMFEPEYADCVVDMQFNQMEFASFPVSKIMEFKVRDGKVFGACYTYAVTYCAVARWNGLDCRVITAGDPKMGSDQDRGAGYCGLAPKNYVEELGLSCNEWKTKGWKMDSLHYWAEVLINGQWKRMETSVGEYKGDTQKYIIDASMNYTVLDW